MLWFQYSQLHWGTPANAISLLLLFSPIILLLFNYKPANIKDRSCSSAFPDSLDAAAAPYSFMQAFTTHCKAPARRHSAVSEGADEIISMTKMFSPPGMQLCVKILRNTFSKEIQSDGLGAALRLLQLFNWSTRRIGKCKELRKI